MAEFKLPNGPQPIDYPAEPAAAESPEVAGTTAIAGPGPSDDLGPIRNDQTTGIAEHDPASRLAEDVRAGRLDSQQAVEYLVERAVADVEGGLSATESAELKETLREALAQDPTLLALRAELEL